MTSQKTSSSNEPRDIIKGWLASRKVLATIFAAFLLIGVICTAFGGAVWVSIGTSLLASALVSLATLLIDQIRSGEQMRASALTGAGLVAAFERRDLPEYEGLVRTASGIDIAGYTLKSFSETNATILRDRAAAGRAIAVRVLLVDPDCEAARTMERWEELPPGSYGATFRSVQTRLRAIPGVEIKKISHALPMMIYRIDDVLYTGPFPSDGKSRMAPTLKLGLRGWLFERHREEFEVLWSQGRAADATGGSAGTSPGPSHSIANASSSMSTPSAPAPQR